MKKTIFHRLTDEQLIDRLERLAKAISREDSARALLLEAASRIREANCVSTGVL
jgi:hypothetical protein